MKQTSSLNWPLIMGLGALALVRPAARIIEKQLELAASPAMPLVITAVISVVWIVVVGLSRTARPVLTLVLTGVVYAVFAIISSAVLSPLLDGALQGPLANPLAIIPMLVTNAGWGLVAGFLAFLLQRLRGQSERPTGHKAGASS